jgi:hypothetical protein
MSQYDEGNMSRRRLLKLIAATGGAVAASGLVPAQWITPVVNVGTLPALAQVASPWIDLELREEDSEGDCEVGSATELFADYYDPTGGITADTEVCLQFEWVCEEDGATAVKTETKCMTLGELGGDWSGGAKEGSIYAGCVCLDLKCDIPPECDVTILAWLDGSNVIEMPCQSFFAPGCRQPAALQDMLQALAQTMLAE